MAADFDSAVIDSSFILAFLLPDEDIPEVIETIELFKQKGLNLISSHLFSFEVFNCLKTAVARKRISKDLAIDLGNTFLDLDIKHEDVDFVETLRIAQEENLSFYDASYVYLAKLKRMPLLTLDSRLKRLV